MSKKILERRFLMKSTFTILVLCGILVTASLSHAVSTMAASGQCYTTQGTYYFNEPIVVIIRTYTGINNTRVIIYLQNYGQINTITIGKVGIGEWQFRIGVAGPPEGYRQLVLADGETTLSSAGFFVMGPSTPPPPPLTPPSSSSPSTTIIQTTISHETLTSYVTVPITVSEQITTAATTTLPAPIDIDYIMLAIIIVLIALVISLLAIFSARRRT